MVNNITESKDSLKWCSVSLADVISRGKRLEASVFDRSKTGSADNSKRQISAYNYWRRKRIDNIIYGC